MCCFVPIVSDYSTNTVPLHLIYIYKEHEKVFSTVPIVGFKKGKSLKDFLVRAKVPPIEKPKGGCAPCGGNDVRCVIL